MILKTLAINEEIIKKTTRCTKKLSCLAGDRDDLCKVEFCVEEKIHFIKCLDKQPCNYRIPFGYSHVCICPVRKELYNKYKV
jgi:hypothetical protein